VLSGDARRRGLTDRAAAGTDADGGSILKRLAEAGVDTSQVMRRPGPSTRSLVLTDPEGERTVVNLYRCREDGPPRRLRARPADALHVRSRELDLGRILAAPLESALVTAVAWGTTALECGGVPPRERILALL
jgi:sugar/nucleoside kinase (ribokinase family)